MRDCLRGEEPNDVDIVVGGTYTEVRNCINDFFVACGKPLTDHNFIHEGKIKKFGQMKIMNIKVQ